MKEKFRKIKIKKYWGLVYSVNKRGLASKLAIEYAVYAKSTAPKFTPSRTKAKVFIGCVPAINWSTKREYVSYNGWKKLLTCNYFNVSENIPECLNT